MRLLTCGYVDIGNCQSHPWSGIPHCHPSPSAITSYHKLSAAYLCYQLKLNIGHFHLVRIRHWHFTAASQERRSQCWHWVLVGLGGWRWELCGRRWEKYRPAPAPVRCGLLACLRAENRGTVLRSTPPPAARGSGYYSSWNLRRTFEWPLDLWLEDLWGAC